MRYKTVIFDLDGTLVDSSVGIIKGVNDALNKMGHSAASPCQIQSYIGPPIVDALISKHGLERERRTEFNILFREIYNDKYLADTLLYPGIYNLLSNLSKECFIGVATNKRKDSANMILKNLEIYEYIDIVEGMDSDMMSNKGDMIEKCITLSGVEKKDVVVIGDTSHDESAAKACGVDFIGVTFGFGFKKETDVCYGSVVSDILSLQKLLFNKKYDPLIIVDQ